MAHDNYAHNNTVCNSGPKPPERYVYTMSSLLHCCQYHHLFPFLSIVLFLTTARTQHDMSRDPYDEVSGINVTGTINVSDCTRLPPLAAEVVSEAGPR